MSVKHYKMGEYVPAMLRNGAVIILGGKPPKGLKKKLKEDKEKSQSEFDKQASQLYRRLMSQMREDMIQKDMNRRSLLESTTQDKDEPS